MIWTRNKPDEPGFYWQRNNSRDERPIVVAVTFLLDGGPFFYLAGRPERLRLSDFSRSSQWCKIPEPEK